MAEGYIYFSAGNERGIFNFLTTPMSHECGGKKVFKFVTFITYNMRFCIHVSKEQYQIYN